VRVLFNLSVLSCRCFQLITEHSSEQTRDMGRQRKWKTIVRAFFYLFVENTNHVFNRSRCACLSMTAIENRLTAAASYDCSTKWFLFPSLFLSLALPFSIGRSSSSSPSMIQFLDHLTYVVSPYVLIASVLSLFFFLRVAPPPPSRRGTERERVKE
jgi:hypothetical protein